MYLMLKPGSDSSQSFLQATCRARTVPMKAQENSCFWLERKRGGEVGKKNILTGERKFMARPRLPRKLSLQRSAHLT